MEQTKKLKPQIINRCQLHNEVWRSLYADSSVRSTSKKNTNGKTRDLVLFQKGAKSNFMSRKYFHSSNLAARHPFKSLSATLLNIIQLVFLMRQTYNIRIHNGRDTKIFDIQVTMSSHEPRTYVFLLTKQHSSCFDVVKSRLLGSMFRCSKLLMKPKSTQLCSHIIIIYI